ncbi:MAG TPA: extracellular solute-binding protein, partial [Rhodoglobus sp.]|nr:extracellular solute-binding protein [Rhodoglobus sp.]
VLTKVELGEVDAGLVYRTDVLAAGAKVKGIEFPEAAGAIARYPIAALTASANPDAAAAFVAFVLSDAGQQILQEAGFGAP